MNKTSGRWIITRMMFAVGCSVSIILSACKAERPHATQVIAGPTPGAGITEITFERDGCYGACPVYQVTFEKDGCAIYDGFGYVPWVGHYKGYIYPGDFDRLAQLIDERGFFAMQHRYGNFNVLDISHHGLSVVKNGVRTSVKVAGWQGEPLSLYELGQVIDGTVFKIKWWGKDHKLPYVGFAGAERRPESNCPWSRKGPEPFAPNMKHSP